MNIMWMTLLAMIGLTFASALQWTDLRQDQWWQQLFQFYDKDRQNREYEFQRQEFHQVRRSVAFLGSIPESQVKPDQPSDVIDAQLMMQRIKLYPLNARLPLSGKLLFESSNTKIWQAAWWGLLDSLYGRQEFYIKWREMVNPGSFLNELVEQIKLLQDTFPSSGTYGLSLLKFQDFDTQLVWQEMLRGSDRSGCGFPSLMGYVWPVDLVKGVFSQKLNLVYANPITTQALMGPEFTRVWFEKVQEKKLEAQKKYVKAYDLQAWVLTRKVYEDIFEQVVRETGLSGQEYKEIIDFAAGPWIHAQEILLRNEQGHDEILSSQIPQRK